MDIHDKKEIGKEFFDTIRDSDKKVCFGDEDIKWIFKGKDIIHSSKDIDMSVDMIPLPADETEHGKDMGEKIGHKDAMVIRFPENGELSGKCEVRVTADYSFRKYMGTTGLHVYYYNVKTEKFEEISINISISEDNSISFEIEHCSDYIIMNEALDEQYISDGEEATTVYGDANGDGKVDSKDAVLIKKYIAAFKDLNMDETASDVNLDGGVDSKDAVLLMKYLAGFKVELGKEQ